MIAIPHNPEELCAINRQRPFCWVNAQCFLKEIYSSLFLVSSLMFSLVRKNGNGYNACFSQCFGGQQRCVFILVEPFFSGLVFKAKAKKRPKLTLGTVIAVQLPITNRLSQFCIGNCAFIAGPTGNSQAAGTNNTAGFREHSSGQSSQRNWEQQWLDEFVRWLQPGCAGPGRQNHQTEGNVETRQWAVRETREYWWWVEQKNVAVVLCLDGTDMAFLI